jgi:uncharacterized protein (TIGR02996 family)
MTKKASTDARGGRQRLERTLRDGNFPAALEFARVAWENSRAPSLAALVERISSRLPTAVADWQRAPRGLDGTTLPAYLDSILLKVRFPETLRRLDILEDLPPDPRIAAFLTGLVLRPPFTADSSRKGWRSIERQLTGQHADPRTLSALEPVAATYTNIFGSTPMGEQMQRRVQAMVAALRERFPAIADDAAAAEFVARLEAATPPTAAPAGLSEAELLAAVYENPDRDEPRLVYADWLLERGNPRGELIVLQCKRHRGETLAPAEEKRERALLAKHARAWHGPLSEVLKGSRFRRGFVESGVLLPRTPRAAAAAINHPAWATVRKLDLHLYCRDQNAVDILVQPALRGLRVLGDATPSAIEALVGLRDHGLEIISTGNLHYQLDPEQSPWPTLLKAPGLPRLQELHIELPPGYPPTRQMPERWAPVLEALWSSPLGARLPCLRVSGLLFNQLDAWVAWLAAHRPPAACKVEVELNSDEETVRVRKGKAGERGPKRETVID